MTTNAQLATQVANALTRWNAELDQLADWLGGSPTGGPNLDGRYPLTNAESETELFLCLPALIDTINGPAGQAEAALTAIQVIETAIAQDATDAENEADRAEGLRDATQILKDRAEVLRDEVAAYWAAVQAKAAEVANDASVAANALTGALTAKDDAIDARDDAVVARNEAETFSIAVQTFDPVDYIPSIDKGAANGVATLDIAGKISAAQLPALVTVETFVEADETGQLTAPAEQGDVVVRTDLLQSFIHNGGTSGTMSDWQQLLSPTSDVQSVDGRVGAITLNDLYADVSHTHSDYVSKSSTLQTTMHSNLVLNKTNPTLFLTGDANSYYPSIQFKGRVSAGTVGEIGRFRAYAPSSMYYEFNSHTFRDGVSGTTVMVVNSSGVDISSGSLTVGPYDVEATFDAIPTNYETVSAVQSKTLSAQDVGPLLNHFGSWTTTYTLPKGSGDTVPLGSKIRIVKRGTGSLTIDRNGNALFNGSSGTNITGVLTVGASGYVELTKVASSLWLFVGNAS